MSVKVIKFKNRTNDKIFVHKFEVSNIDEYTVDGVELPNGTKITGPIKYDSVSDFANVQGTNNWYYLYNSNKTKRSVALQYDSKYNLYGKPGATGTPVHHIPFINSVGGHPGKGSEGESLRYIRRWRAPYTGKVNVKGTIKDADIGGGDGIFGWGAHWSNADKKTWDDNSSYVDSYDANTKILKGFGNQITGKIFTPWAADQKTGYDKTKIVDFSDTGALFTGNTDMTTLKKNTLVVPVKARYIRWYPQAYHSHKTMRVGAYDMSGTELVNSRPKSSFVASDYWENRDDHSAWRARLVNHANGHSNWSTAGHGNGQWIQVDLGSIKEISAVSTKGRHCCYHQWVKDYFLAYSTDGIEWIQAHPTSNTLTERIQERSYDVDLTVKKGDFIDHFVGPDVTANWDSTHDNISIEYISTAYWLDNNGVIRDAGGILTGVVLEDEESIDIHLNKPLKGESSSVNIETLKVHYLCDPPGGYSYLYDENTSKVVVGATAANGWYTVKSKKTGHTLYVYLPRDTYAGNGWFMENGFFKGWLHKASVAENPWSEGEWFYANPNNNSAGMGWFWFNMDIFPFVWIKKYNSWGYLGKHTTKTNPGGWQYRDLCVWNYAANSWRWFGTDLPVEDAGNIQVINRTTSTVPGGSTGTGGVPVGTAPSSSTIESTPSSFIGWGETKQHTISLTGVGLDAYEAPVTLTINSNNAALTGQYNRLNTLHEYRYEWLCTATGSRLCWLTNGWYICSNNRSTKYAKYAGNEAFPEDGSFYSSRNSPGRNETTGWQRYNTSVGGIDTIHCGWASRTVSDTALQKPTDVSNELRLDIDNSGKTYRYEIGDTEDRSVTGVWEVYIGFTKKNTNKSYSYLTYESHGVLNLKDIPIQNHIDITAGPYMKVRRIGFISGSAGISFSPWSDTVDLHVPFLYIKAVYPYGGTRKKKGWIDAYLCTDRKSQFGGIFHDCAQDTRFTITVKKGNTEFKYPLLRTGCHIYVGVNNNLQPLMEAGTWSLKVSCNDRVLISKTITIQSGSWWKDPKIIRQQTAGQDTGNGADSANPGWLPIIGGVGYKGWYNDNWECCVDNEFDDECEGTMGYMVADGNMNSHQHLTVDIPDGHKDIDGTYKLRLVWLGGGGCECMILDTTSSTGTTRRFKAAGCLSDPGINASGLPSWGNVYKASIFNFTYGDIHKISGGWIRANGYNGKTDNPVRFYKWEVWKTTRNLTTGTDSTGITTGLTNSPVIFKDYTVMFNIVI